MLVASISFQIQRPKEIHHSVAALYALHTYYFRGRFVPRTQAARKLQRDQQKRRKPFKYCTEISRRKPFKYDTEISRRKPVRYCTEISRRKPFRYCTEISDSKTPSRIDREIHQGEQSVHDAPMHLSLHWCNRRHYEMTAKLTGCNMAQQDQSDADRPKAQTRTA